MVYLEPDGKCKLCNGLGMLACKAIQKEPVVPSIATTYCERCLGRGFMERMVIDREDKK